MSVPYDRKISYQQMKHQGGLLRIDLEAEASVGDLPGWLDLEAVLSAAVKEYERQSTATVTDIRGRADA